MCLVEQQQILKDVKYWYVLCMLAATSITINLVPIDNKGEYIGSLLKQNIPIFPRSCLDPCNRIYLIIII
jgi:hypothetical protein